MLIAIYNRSGKLIGKVKLNPSKLPFKVSYRWV